MSVTQGKVKFTYKNFADSDVSFEIPKPLFGYTTTISMPITTTILPNGTIQSVDNCTDIDPTTNDMRRCECRFAMNQTDYATFTSKVFDLQSQGQLFTMELDGYGFEPFGSDKGDSGEFTVLIYVDKETTKQRKPQGIYFVDVELVNAGTYPAYTLPEVPAYISGTVTVGDVDNISFPQKIPGLQIKRQEAFTIEGGYNVTRHSGDAFSISPTTLPRRSEIVSSLFDFRLRRPKVAELLDHITTDIRAADFSFSAGTNAYPFGYHYGSGVFANCKLLNKDIVITHNKFDEYFLSLNIGKNQ